MKILHYSLGFPPYRSGGLTKYATDLMEEQVNQGHEVILLWPGKINLLNKKLSIKHSEDKFGITGYEIINPLPVPLLNGIKEVEFYMKKCDKNTYKDFLNKIKPDVIHIHTLMGIHKEFFEVSKEMQIKLIYTSHDYFGICPKVNLLFNNSICNDNKKCLNCTECNKNALSMKKIMILQSSLYRIFKESSIIKKCRSNYKKKSYNSKKVELEDNRVLENNNKKYIDLRNYYFDIFNMIDKFHFNSTLARDIYLKYLNIKKYEVIPILHKDIKDKRVIKEFNKDLKITYLGPTQVYKGFYLLKSVLDDLYKEGYTNFKLNIYYETLDSSQYMNIQSRFEYSELESIFKNTDLLVVPSIWYETFSFVAMEGYSYGVPLIITTNVGAKDIIKPDITGIIIKPYYKELKEKIKLIYNNRNLLKNINNEIVNDLATNFKFEDHVKEIIKFYK